MMNEVFTIILKIMASVAIAAISIYVIPAVKAFINSIRDTRLYNFMETAVRAAEKLYPESGKGDMKKSYVMHKVCKWLGENGYDESYLEIIETMLEECVYMLENDD